jgi:hypothetical protein
MILGLDATAKLALSSPIPEQFSAEDRTAAQIPDQG